MNSDFILKNFNNETFEKPWWDKGRENRQVVYYIYPTHACNLRCDYCFYRDTKYQNSKMDDETIEAVADFLLKWEPSKYIRIHFFGGEPFVVFDVMDKIVHKLVEKFTDSGKEISFSATTNGTLIRDKFDWISSWFGSRKMRIKKDNKTYRVERPWNVNNKTIYVFYLEVNDKVTKILETDVWKREKIEEKIKSEFSQEDANMFIDIYRSMARPFLLSLDGPKHIHDKHRKQANGEGSWDLIPYKEILQQWPKIEVRPTFTTDMLPDEAFEAYMWLVKQGFTSIGTEPDYDNYGKPWTEEEIKAWEEFVYRLAWLWYELQESGHYYYVKPIQEVISLFFEKGNDIPKHFLCGRGWNSMGIAADGSIYPCQRWAGYRLDMNPKEYRLGHVKTGINLNRLFWVQQINRSEMIPPKKFDCLDCPMRSKCYGGCNAMNWYKFGTRFQIDENYCAIQQANFRAVMRFVFASEYYYNKILPKLKRNQQEKRNVNCKNCYTCENCFTSQGGNVNIKAKRGKPPKIVIPKVLK